MLPLTATDSDAEFSENPGGKSRMAGSSCVLAVETTTPSASASVAADCTDSD